MKNILLSSISLAICFSTLIGCGEQANDSDKQEVKDTLQYVASDEEIAYDEYIMSIENNDTLTNGRSLYYSKSNGFSTEVEFFSNEENEMVKIIEYYTLESNSIAKNIFYFKDGRKFVSRELFEDGEGANMRFVERLTYYGEDEKPIVTKRKTAMYEEELDYEAYEIVPKHDCSMQRAIDILNQKGEFATYFKGFIKEEAFTYLIVGGKEKGSFSSPLIVQQMTPTIIKLQEDQEAMLGMPLIVDFEVVIDPGQGFEYQILKSVNLR